MKPLKAVLSEESLMRMAGDLEDLAGRLTGPAMKEADEKLAAMGAETAQENFGPDITVTADGNRIIANGEQVVFLEFGAGATTVDMWGADLGFEIDRGSYSDEHDGEYAKSGYEMWHHAGQEYEYIQPTYAMFRAKLQIQRDAAEEIRKVVNAL